MTNGSGPGSTDRAFWDRITIQAIASLLRDVNQEWQDKNRTYYDGDHWQDGDGWVGPRPNPDAPNHSTIMTEIQRGFVSANKVKEVTDRHMNGVAGKEPTWKLVPRRPLKPDEAPNADEQALIDEANALVVEWFDEREAHTRFQEALITMLLEERATLRLWIPRGKVRDGRIPPGDVEQQIKRIFLDHPKPGQATVTEDPETLDPIGVYAYRLDAKDRAEIVAVDDTTGETVIRWIAQDYDPDVEASEGGDETTDGDRVMDVRLKLGGRLTMFEFRRGRLITDQVIQLQRLINLALSMMPRNVNLAGFLERIILNGEVPGHWEKDPDAPNGQRWVEDKFRPGAGSVSFIKGITSTDDAGNETIMTPSVVYRDPISVATFAETKEQAYLAILEEVDQLHAKIAGDATATGESRRQAMAAFLADLRITASRINRAGRWMVETVLALSAAMAGSPGRYDGLRCDFMTRVDPGPSTAEDMNTALSAYDKRVLSLETTQTRLGVDDTDAEQARINAERDADLNPPANDDGGDRLNFGDPPTGDEE